MGLMDLFGKSFQKKVDEAVAKVRAAHPAVKGFRADVAGKVVTLSGEAPDADTKARVMAEFNRLVDTDNTINALTTPPPPKAAEPAPPPAPAPAPAAEPRIHEVQRGDTLGAIALKYYGKANLYMKIFEANRDQLDNPDLIKVGQKLRIPE